MASGGNSSQRKKGRGSAQSTASLRNRRAVKRSSAKSASRSKTAPRRGVDTRPHVVYEIREPNGCLVYIGKTLNPRSRFETHKRNGVCSMDAKMTFIGLFEDCRDAERVEEAAIRAHLPPRNKRYRCKKMEKSEAWKIWRNPNLSSVEALKLMFGWHQTSARLVFGSRPWRW